MKKVIVFIVFSLTLVTKALYSQEQPSDIRQKRVSYMSQRMSISNQAASKMVDILDAHKENSNKVYHDSTLTVKQRVAKLQQLREDMQKSLDMLSATERNQKLNTQIQRGRLVTK